MRPRSPVGVQEWVASLPIPSEMSSPPLDFEQIPMSDQMLQKSQNVSCTNTNLSSISKEKLKYQDKQSQHKTVCSLFCAQHFSSLQ